MLKMAQRLWKSGVVLKVNGEVPLTLYSSSRSKLRVAVADVPGPMVKGVLSFVTETHTDDGLPHTLEHLVFMGSEKYPFKGFLDIIASRCLASGTNAWTDQANTAYTLETVGSSGFLKVLPVYMDHVLSPTLTDEQFITEVHHITGEGDDAGVVYCEMQDHESEMEEIVSRKRKELFYPENCPYRVETGGRLGPLRTSCNNSAVRKFHSEFYHLDNMMIIVCGIIDHNKLLDVISDVEDGMLSRVPSSFQKPFTSKIPLIEEGRDAVVLCPSDNEELGIVEISWAGPPATDLYRMRAFKVLFEYMEETAAAPLQQHFVQLADPFASSVGFCIIEQTTCEIILTFSGVPVKKLQQIKERLFAKTFAQYSDEKSFDMQRLGFVIEKLIQTALEKMETGCHDKVFEMLIGHQLYGIDEDLPMRVNQIDTLRKLAGEPASFWANLIKCYFTDRCVCVVGQPSVHKVAQFAKIEKDRIECQRKKLGSQGLADCGEKVKKAVEMNTSKKPAPSMLSDLIVKDLEKFNSFDITVLSNLEKVRGREIPFLDELPFGSFVHRAPTKFIELSLIWDTNDIPVEKRIWLMLWAELLFESPARVGNEVLPYEEVAKLSIRDLVSRSCSVGVAGSFERYVTLALKATVEKCNVIPKWMEIFMQGLVFDATRVMVTAQKLTAQAVEEKRDGYSVCSVLLSKAVNKLESNSHLLRMIPLEKFHEMVAKKAASDPQWVVKELESLRRSLLSSPVNMHLACNDSLLQSEFTDCRWSFLNPPKRDFTTMKFKSSAGESLNVDGFGTQLLTAVGGTESSFLMQCSHFNFDWQCDAVAATMLLSRYLSQCEGPLYRGIRGEGLAYGANIYVLPDKKLLTLSIYRSAQVIQAYEKTKKIVVSVLEDKKFDLSEFEAAKRSLVCDLVGTEDTVEGAVTQSVLKQFRGVPSDFVRQLCARLWNITIEEAIAVGSPHLNALFDEHKFVRAVAVHPSKVKEVRNYFKGIHVISTNNLAVTNDSSVLTNHLFS